MPINNTCSLSFPHFGQDTELKFCIFYNFHTVHTAAKFINSGLKNKNLFSLKPFQ